VKVVNEDGASVSTKVAVKQLRYMPITLRLCNIPPGLIGLIAYLYH
jgi:hypothetical protein